MFNAVHTSQCNLLYLVVQDAMDRKKKSRSSISAEERPGDDCLDKVEDGESHVPPDDWLDLRLVRPQSCSGSRNSQKDPTIFLAEQDAYRIDVTSGDEVFVLSRVSVGDQERVVATAVCYVRINANGATPSKSASPLGKGRQSISRLFRGGSCRVSPDSLAAQLSSADDELPPESTDTPLTKAFSSPATPSSSKAVFSFAHGGGGDLIISPSSARRQASPVSSSLSRLALTCIWVIPLQCPLGERFSNSITSEASRVSLCLVGDNNDPETLSKSQRVIQRLVLANHVGRYLSEMDTIVISFQGKSLELKVKRIEAKQPAQGIDELCSSVAEMSIGSSENDAILNALRLSLNENDHKRRILLNKLSFTTEIVITHDSQILTAALEPTDTPKPRASHRVVAGLDMILEQVKSILLSPLTHTDLFKNHSLPPPRGVLLHGPSGCGKSLLAEQVKLDLESDIHVQTVNCTSLQSRTAIVGEAERYLTRLFRSAQRNHENPGTLLILDDIHLICSKRGRHNPGADRLAATLLALLDGIGSGSNDEGRGNLVILAITADPSLLDPALRRPGRLDSEVEVSIPDEVTRGEILRFQLERLGSDVSIPELTNDDYIVLSRLAKGFNGADTMLAIKGALQKAIATSISSNGIKDSSMILLTRSLLEASIRTTNPSTISSITLEIPRVHWTSIGGMDDVKQKLRESIELPITHAHLFEALNIPPPRGVLLYGPPGCSKTLMARALATDGQMNFLAVKGPELLSKWLGESERALASLFRRARMASPCIIFFDEIDAIASKRGGGEGSSGGERLLSQLLTELDGINSGSANKERVIVVGATNRPDLLDSAMTRPGRIDRMIYVGLPDERSRARIFEIGLKGKACANDIQISVLASANMTGGFSGAELIAICREAALLAIEEDDKLEGGSPEIAMRHLTRAIAEMQRQVTPEMLDFYATFNTSKLTI